MGHCPLSTNQLYVHSSGEVFTCSFLQNKPDYVLGNVQNQSLQEIWNSEQRIAFAQTHKSGELRESCHKYQQDFLCNKIGNRTYFDKSDRIKRLDIMLDSACNLKCIMCTNIFDRTGGLRSDFFWENNDETFSSIEEIEIVGGEPVISPHFFRLLDLVSKLNSGCRWFMTTNAHYELDEKILSSFKKVKFQSLSISLDSLKKEVFEKIRLKSSFEKVMSNIAELKNHLPEIQINTVIQRDNYDELIPLYFWCQEQGFKFYPILLQYPDTYSLKHVSVLEKKDWLLQVMKQNDQLRSKEIFFLIKKVMAVDPVGGIAEVKMQYLRQLEIMREHYGPATF